MTTTPVTVDKLRTFIEAVEFATDADDWVPSPRQWAKIREMIDNLVQDPVRPVATAASAPPMQMPPVYPQYPYQAPPTHTGLVDMQPQMYPSAPPLNTGGGGSGLLNGVGSVRTPDIDTSNGKPYTPQFV